MSKRRPWLLVLDFVCVMVFVIIGRHSHTEGETLSGIIRTSWPFVAGLAGSWLATKAWRHPRAITPTGITAWTGCVTLGMILRVIAGQGTALSFILVALVFLGATMLGWRAVSLRILKLQA